MKTRKRLACMRAFHRRMIAEAAIHSLAWAAAAGIGMAMLVTAGLHGFTLGARLGLLLGIGLGSGVAVWAAALWRMWPTMKKTAHRLDALGLKERVSTLYARRESNHLMDELQREDAQACLERIDPGKLRVTLPWRQLGICLCALLIMMGMAHLPYGLLLSQKAKEQAVMSEERQKIEALLAQMREQVENAALSEEERAALMEQIAMLSEMMAQSDSELTALAQLEKASEEMNALLEVMKREESFLGGLMKANCLYKLALAIVSEQEDQVVMAFDDLESWILHETGKARKERLQEIVTGIEEAQTQMAEDAADGFYVPLFNQMARGFQRVIWTDFDAADEIEEIRGTLDEAETLICQAFSALTAQNPEQSSAEEEESSGSTASAAGGGAPTDDQSQGSDTAAGFGDMLYQGGSKGVSVPGTRLGGRQDETAELVYEPSLDTRRANSSVIPEEESVLVPYSDVYGEYYARMLEESEQMPEDIQKKVNAYFGDI